MQRMLDLAQAPGVSKMLRSSCQGALDAAGGTTNDDKWGNPREERHYGLFLAGANWPVEGFCMDSWRSNKGFTGPGNAPGRHRALHARVDHYNVWIIFPLNQHR